MPEPTKQDVLDALRAVNDPQRQQDLVSLDSIRKVALCDGIVAITVELPPTTEAVQARVRTDVSNAVRAIDGITEVNVDVVAGQAKPAVAGPLPGIRHIVAVGAGKGGVGKSTVAVLLAWGLRRKGYSVGLMDADVYGPSIPKLVGLEGVEVDLVPDPDGRTGPDGQPLARWLPPEVDDIRVMSPGFAIASEQAAIMRGPMISNVFKQLMFDLTLWGDLDYLVVDLPPGTGDIPLTLAQTIPQAGAVAVVVSTPQQVALLDALKALAMYRKLNIEVVGMVENMSYFIAPDTGREYDLFGKGGAAAAAEQAGVPLLGSLPINIVIRESGDAGTPGRIFDDASPGLAEAATQLVDALITEIDARQAAAAAPVQLTITDE